MSRGEIGWIVWLVVASAMLIRVVFAVKEKQ